MHGRERLGRVQVVAQRPVERLVRATGDGTLGVRGRAVAVCNPARIHDPSPYFNTLYPIAGDRQPFVAGAFDAGSFPRPVVRLLRH